MTIRTPQNNIEWEQYYNLRFRVLREPWNQPRGSERNEHDAIALHLACFEQDELCGVVRLDTHESATQAQIRFMAVDPSYQGKGIGKKLMQAAEQKAIQLGFSKMMLQARENALPFYQSLHYKLIEKSHLLFGEIQHFRMEKNLKT
jgi:GNAT superfamily N-acetyltransferase